MCSSCDSRLKSAPAPQVIDGLETLWTPKRQGLQGLKYCKSASIQRTSSHLSRSLSRQGHPKIAHRFIGGTSWTSRTEPRQRRQRWTLNVVIDTPPPAAPLHDLVIPLRATTGNSAPKRSGSQDHDNKIMRRAGSWASSMMGRAGFCRPGRDWADREPT